MLRQAEISRHAYLRFLKRWEGEPPACYRTELERIISLAIETSIGYGAAVRAITNGFQPARYFTAENWRLVVSEDLTIIMTIERPYVQSHKPHRRIRDKKRYGGKP